MNFLQASVQFQPQGEKLGTQILTTYLGLTFNSQLFKQNKKSLNEGKIIIFMFLIENGNKIQKTRK